MVCIPSHLRGRARREAAAFYLSQIAQGLLAGEFGDPHRARDGVGAAHRRPDPRDHVHAEAARRSPLACGSGGLDPSLETRQRPLNGERIAGQARAEGESPRIYVAVIWSQHPGGETLTREMRMTGDTSEMTARRPGDGARPASRGPRARRRGRAGRRRADPVHARQARVTRSSSRRTAPTRSGRPARRRPDVMLLDIMVPQVNGWEVCRRLKQDPATRAVPVIMVTGRAEEGDKVLGFELGADDYVTKPFSHARAGGAGARRGAADAAGRGGRDEGTGSRSGTSRSTGSDSRSRVGGRAVELTPKEFELLATLAAAPGPGVRAGRAARPRVGPGRLRRAPHGRRARRPAARRSSWPRAFPSLRSRRSGASGIAIRESPG